MKSKTINSIQTVLGSCPDNRSLCDPSADTCYLTEFRCVHETYKGYPLHCPGLEHLQHCDGFECPHMYKCTDNYCIPTRMLCDGNPDCPDGEDEESCQDFQCAGLLRCRGDDICVHPTDICDGIIHCLLSADDEDLCHMLNCPEHCACRGSAVLCTHLEHISDVPSKSTAVILEKVLIKDTLYHLSTVLYIKMLHCTFPGNIVTPKIFIDISEILTLILANNNIHSVIRNSFITMMKLTYIDLRNNHIHTINPLNFVGLTSLESLYLYNFQIITLNIYSFDGMIFLKMLNLSTNAITTLNQLCFYGPISIETIDLRYNKLLSMELLSFHVGLVHVRLHFDESMYCCFIGTYQHCYIDGYHHPSVSQCEAMLNIISIDIVDIVFSVIVLSFHLIALVFQGTHERMSSHVALLKHLAMANTILTIYLILLCVARLMYKSELIYLNTLWLQSDWCHLLEIIFFIGYLTPTCFWFLLVVNQLIAVRYVFRQCNRRIIIVYIPGAVWLTMILLAVGQQRITQGSCIVCSPFLISHELSDGTQLISLILVNTIVGLMIVGIVIMYYLIVDRVKKSNARVQSTIGNARIKSVKSKAMFTISIQLILWMTMSIVSFYTYFHADNQFVLRITISMIVHSSECLHILYFSRQFPVFKNMIK